jgi:ankyrin repeat protein
VAELDDETIAYAQRMFDLARSGRTEELIDNILAGLPANLTNANGDTLLILAAYHNHVDMVIALLEQGASPNRTNDRGQSALSAAVFRQNAESVKALLAVGADPDGGAPSAMATAEFFDLPEMAALMRESGTRAM